MKTKIFPWVRGQGLQIPWLLTWGKLKLLEHSKHSINICLVMRDPNYISSERLQKIETGAISQGSKNVRFVQSIIMCMYAKLHGVSKELDTTERLNTYTN